MAKPEPPAVGSAPMNPSLLRFCVVFLSAVSLCNVRSFAAPADPLPQPTGSVIIDHSSADLAAIPVEAIKAAKDRLVIAYGHTSHGSQLVEGLKGLEQWKGAPYTLRSATQPDGLALRDTPFSGARDLGNPDRTAWVAATQNYLREHPETNVVLWSWCGQVSSASEAQIATYLANMDALEKEFPHVRFVYFTGHLDGTGPEGNLHRRNEQIRDFVKKNGKILYDFADIESFDPDGTGYLDQKAKDNCDYEGGNWALDWQAAHPSAWYPCGSAHSQPLNANRKAYAAWHLFARLAGGK